MSEIATYKLEVDWNDDGDFGDAGEDVTADFVSASVTRGYGDALARVPGVASATFLLNNLSRQYSPPLHASVTPGRHVRWSMTYGGTTVVLFDGTLEDIQPTFGQFGERKATLVCTDAMALLDLHDGEMALLTNVTADQVIAAAVAAAYTPAATAYQTGINIFPTSSPGWEFARRGTHGLLQVARATDKIEEACASDWGRFFIAKSGAPTYYNRHKMALDSDVKLALNDTMLDMSYAKPMTHLRNHVAVTCYPRTVGSVYEVLGSLTQQHAPLIEASGTLTLVIPFRDPANSAIRVGGKELLTPVAGIDLVCSSDPEGQGTDETANVTPTVTAYSDRAEVILTNGVARPVYVQTLQIRGLAVRAQDPVTVVAQDATSIAARGKRKLDIHAPLISDPADAQLLANYLLSYYLTPLNVIENVQILANKDATWMAAVRDLELGDLVEITETQTGLSAFRGFVMSLTHTYVSRYEHRLTLAIEEAYTLSGTPFRIGVSALNSGHVLIY